MSKAEFRGHSFLKEVEIKAQTQPGEQSSRHDPKLKYEAQLKRSEFRQNRRQFIKLIRIIEKKFEFRVHSLLKQVLRIN